MGNFLSGAFALFVLPALAAAGIKRLPEPLAKIGLVLLGVAAVAWLLLMWIGIRAVHTRESGITNLLGILLVGGTPICGIYLGQRYL
jgi:hypothetical protein